MPHRKETARPGGMKHQMSFLFNLLFSCVRFLSLLFFNFFLCFASGFFCFILLFDDILQGAGVYSAFSWARLLVLRPRGSLLVQTIYIVSGDLLMLVTLTTCSRSVVRHECYIHSRSRLTGSPWHSPDPGGPTASGRHCLAWMCRFRSTECNPSHTHRPRGLADHSDL